jgi:SOS response regulatory protein OraA/RecX
MGLDFMEVNDFLEDKAIPESNIELVIDYLKDPRYVNKLRMVRHPQR